MLFCCTDSDKVRIALNFNSKLNKRHVFEKWNDAKGMLLKEAHRTLPSAHYLPHLLFAHRAVKLLFSAVTALSCLTGSPPCPSQFPVGGIWLQVCAGFGIEQVSLPHLIDFS